MSGKALLLQLRNAGLSVSVDADQLVITPRGRLTDSLRTAIRQSKPELARAIAADLDDRIRAMAKRWRYSADELTEALNGAKTDPAGWLSWVERDERLFKPGGTVDDTARIYARIRGQA